VGGVFQTAASSVGKGLDCFQGQEGSVRSARPMADGLMDRGCAPRSEPPLYELLLEFTKSLPSAWRRGVL